MGSWLQSKLLDMVPGNAARKVSAGLQNQPQPAAQPAAAPQPDGHTTSGLDYAMQQHADQIHPVNRAPRLRTSFD